MKRHLNATVETVPTSEENPHCTIPNCKFMAWRDGLCYSHFKKLPGFRPEDRAVKDA
jgi:hypothetical protein